MLLLIFRGRGQLPASAPGGLKSSLNSARGVQGLYGTRRRTPEVAAQLLLFLGSLFSYMELCHVFYFVRCVGIGGQSGSWGEPSPVPAKYPGKTVRLTSRAVTLPPKLCTVKVSNLIVNSKCARQKINPTYM